MQVIYPDIERTRIKVNPQDIIRLLGEEEGSVDAYSQEVVNRCIGECEKIMNPAAGYVLRGALEADSTEEIAIEGIRFQAGKIVHKMLKHSETYAFFLVTVGQEPEMLAKDLLDKGDILEGFITDLVASALVDSLAAQVHEVLAALASRRGMKVTNRYSPGYCSWDVAEQQKLFKLFPANTCGISLSESSLMNPVKSISGIIGMGPEVKFNEYTCEICPMKTCHFRKAKNQL
jgi:hypothetical protein